MTKGKAVEQWEELRRKQEERSRRHAAQTIARAADNAAQKAADRAASYEIIAEYWGRQPKED